MSIKSTALCIFMIISLNACTMFNSPLLNLYNERDIQDISDIPQNAKPILAQIAPEGSAQNKDFSNYIKEYFSIWERKQILAKEEDIIKIFNGKNKFYGENFAPRDASFFQQEIDNANLAQINSLNKRAILIKNASLRKLPTELPAFYDPKSPGEGYPFDNLQENLLRIGEPVIISHFTKDYTYAFVETNAKSHGFVKVDSIALIKDNFPLNTLDFAMVFDDNIKIYNKFGNYLESVNLGTLLPFSKEGELLIPTKDEYNYAMLQPATIDKTKLIYHPLKFNKQNAAILTEHLLNKPYGWGGYLNNRDCAQLTKDYFASFGIHIPIFSANQIKVGKYISFDNLTNDEKVAKIKNEAKDFQTILYQKGHVGIYMGEYNNTPIMLHSVWGVKIFDQNLREYRYIIGKSILSSLSFGNELAGFDHKKSNFLYKLSGITILE